MLIIWIQCKTVTHYDTLSQYIKASKLFVILYADARSEVFAIYGIGDGTEATVLYAVGGKMAEKISIWREKYESGIDRTKRNTYRRHLERLGVEQNQYVNSLDRNGKSNITREYESFNGVRQISSTTQRGDNRGTILRDSTEGKTSREIDTDEMYSYRDSAYLDANGDKFSRELDIVDYINENTERAEANLDTYRIKTIKVQFQTLEMKTHAKNFTGWTA